MCVAAADRVGQGVAGPGSGIYNANTTAGPNASTTAAFVPHGIKACVCAAAADRVGEGVVGPGLRRVAEEAALQPRVPKAPAAV